VAVIMGVSGCGKSTVGAALAARLGWGFAEGDALHPPANIAKMRAGQPLDDDDRRPWLAAVAAHIDQWRQGGMPGVITCSALKRRYRRAIIGDRSAVRLVYLCGTPAVIAKRLEARHGHFMPASLLDSQFAALEPPDNAEAAIIVPVDQPVAAIVEDIVTALSPSGAKLSAPA
jgi:carbohydrate kinase (thermoresistant glucokinase family)